MSDDATAPTVNAKREPVRVCLLGSEGSGKTCFLAGMALLREPNRDSPITVTASDSDTVDYLDELAQTLNRRYWPPATSMTNILKMRVGVDGEIIELMVVDYPGEDFRSALGKLKQEQIDVLYEHYTRSETIVLLFDPKRDVEPVLDPEQRKVQIERQLAHLQAIADLWEKQSNGTKPPKKQSVDVAITLTKADLEPSLKNRQAAKDFFRMHAGPLDSKLRSQCHAMQYFPLSAVGQSTAQQLDGKQAFLPSSELSPAGYNELFDWILHRRRMRLWKQRAKLPAVMLLILMLISGGWYAACWHREQTMLEVLNDPNRSRLEKLEDSRTASFPTVIFGKLPSVRQRRFEIFDEEIRGQRERLDAAADQGAVEEVLQHLEYLETLDPRAMQDSIDGLKRGAREKMQNMLFRKVEDAFQSTAGDFLELASDFLREYSDGPHSHHVREMIAERRSQELNAARSEIRNIGVVNAASLATKSDRIIELVQKHRDALESSGEAERMLRAANLAKRFCEMNTYTVRLRGYGSFTSPRSQRLLLRVDGRDIQEFRSSGTSKTVTWRGDPLKIQWSAGQPVEVIWSGKSWRGVMTDVGKRIDRSSIALDLLGGRQELVSIPAGWFDSVEKPFVNFEVEGMSAEDWKAVEAYILPGEAW